MNKEKIEEMKERQRILKNNATLGKFLGKCVQDISDLLKALEEADDKFDILKKRNNVIRGERVSLSNSVKSLTAQLQEITKERDVLLKKSLDK